METQCNWLRSLGAVFGAAPAKFHAGRSQNLAAWQREATTGADFMTNLPWMNILDAQSGAMNCGSSEDLACRDTESAKHLKGAAIASILALGALGVATPLLGKRVKYLKSDGNFFFIAKAFAAGVILATGFVHMMPDAMGALTSDCLPRFPWSKFPFAGFISMLAALVTLIVDFLATQFYEQKRSHGNHDHHAPLQPETEGYAAFESIVTRVASKTNKVHDTGRHDDSSAQIHIVGIRAHAVSHSHSHPEGHHECIDASHEHVHGHVGHSHHTEAPDEGSQQIRHVVISQVLELGILAHSVIIGVSLGVSQSPCTIRPLIAALTFHQFFEGFALGGCISQAEFTNMAAAMMAFFFTVTTPLGVVIGILISEGYNAGSPTALIVEGVFDSISAGILIYMSLVDLIAADFLSKRMRCNRQLQVGSYIALLAGASAMSMLAIWA